MYGIGLQLTSTTIIGGSYSPASLFTANEVGYVYDLSDVTTLFKDVNATQPVTAAADPVALRLDKSRTQSFGSRRNIYFQSTDLTNASWTANRATIAAAGTTSTPRGTLPYYKLTATGTDPQLTQSVFTGAIAGKTYTLSFVAWTDGGQSTEAALFFFGVTGTEQVKTVGITLTTTPTLYSLTGTFTGGAVSTSLTARMDAKELAVGGEYIYVTAPQLEEGSVVTVYQPTTTLPTAWLGNHATQSDPAKRPLYALLPANGLRNLANGSASPADNTYWNASQVSASGVTITRVATGFDGNGLPYADYSVVGTASASNVLYPTVIGTLRNAAVVGQQFITSFLSQVIGGTAPTGQSGMRPEVIGDTAALTQNEVFIGTLVNSTTETLLTVTGTLVVAGSVFARPQVGIRTNIGDTVNYTVRIKALQFELGPTRTAYQFNYSATNISEPPFAQVGALLYDGVDDFMVTSAIDFSGTDEMFLCHGVRKTSDAARAVVVELATGGAGGFRFEAPTAATAATLQFWSSGSTTGAFTASGQVAPVTAVMTGLGDISGDIARLRVNGALIGTSTADQGTGNYANAPIYFGGRGGTSLFFKGYEFSSICCGALANPAQIASAEEWVRQRTAGAY